MCFQLFHQWIVRFRFIVGERIDREFLAPALASQKAHGLVVEKVLHRTAIQFPCVHWNLDGAHPFHEYAGRRAV